MKTVELLKQLQSDCIVFFMKVHNFHWNVEGLDFYPTHKATQKIYEEFADVFDDLAERVIQLGSKPIVTLADALKIAKIKEETKTSFKSDFVFKHILGDYEHFLKEFKQLSDVAEKENDKPTVAYADEMVGKLEKSMWMLKASLA